MTKRPKEFFPNTFYMNSVTFACNSFHQINKINRLGGLRAQHVIGIGKMIFIDMITYLIIC